jgi:hypothetical protein
MGAEARCTLTLKGKAEEGKALLETEELIFRPDRPGGQRLTVRFADIQSLEAVDGVLVVGVAGTKARFAVGAAAPKWLEKIRNPKSRLDKLGVKAGQRVALVGWPWDDGFADELRARGAEVGLGAPRTPVDVVFLAADRRATLAKLATLKGKLDKKGAIWVVRPKGQAAITEADVLEVGRASGLVDVKVVAFSPTHTAEKLVIPVSLR